AACQSLGKMPGLLCGDMPRRGWFGRTHDSFDHSWARMRQRFMQDALGLLRLLEGIASHATGGKGRRLFVPYLDKLERVPMRPQGLEKAANAITRQAKMVCTPQSMSRSITRSATVFAKMRCSPSTPRFPPPHLPALGGGT